MTNTTDYGSPARPPSPFLLLSETRAVFEHGWFVSLRRMMRLLPKGDGHPVLVLPGFLASDVSTRPLRNVLTDLGYAAYPWGLGRNLFVDEHREKEMLTHLEHIFDTHGEKVSIVGWSLGGVFARELAKIAPDKVRFVISLGSPISPDPKYSNAENVFNRFNHKPSRLFSERYKTISTPPSVPTTSIYSKTDGVVSWRASLQEVCPNNPNTENIEAPSSHFGFGVNPLVIFLIADRLAQLEEEWAPFDDRGFKRLFYRSRAA